MLKRVITSLVVGAYAILLVNLGRYFILANILLIMLWGVHEVVHALRQAGFRPVAWIHYVCVAVYIPMYLWRGDLGLLVVLFASVAAYMAIAACTRDPSTTDLLATMLPSLYPSYPLVSFVLLTLSPAEHWRLVIWLMLTTAVSCDICAFFFGRFFGKHKLMPKVSPNKTVEGAVGGFFGSLLTAAVVCLICYLKGDGVPWWHFLALGLLGGTATQVGDMVASYIKRFCNIKDYGSIFPGHGGLLDRIDGILFNAVSYCVYCMFFLL